jgi:hypothetical protein
MDWDWVKMQTAITFVQTALNNYACMGFRAGSFKRAAIFTIQMNTKQCEVFAGRHFFVISSRQDG